MKKQMGKKLSVKMVDGHFVIKYLYLADPARANQPMLIKKATKICDTPEDFLIFMNEYQQQMRGGVE